MIFRRSLFSFLPFKKLVTWKILDYIFHSFKAYLAKNNVNNYGTTELSKSQEIKT
jgi:hypothetical protein